LEKGNTWLTPELPAQRTAMQPSGCLILSGLPLAVMPWRLHTETRMPSEPHVVERPAQPYVAIRAQVTMQTIGTVLPELHPRVFAWLRERDVPPADYPFWKYNVVDMDRGLEVEVGVPVAVAMHGDGQVLADVLAAGRYATLRYSGHPDGLLGVTASLLAWADEQDLTWDVWDTPEGDRWAARLEIYETDPAVEPDMTNWTTQLAFRLAG
jgi:effector-binding domain-containing protein